MLWLAPEDPLRSSAPASSPFPGLSGVGRILKIRLLGSVFDSSWFVFSVVVANNALSPDVQMPAAFVGVRAG